MKIHLPDPIATATSRTLRRRSTDAETLIWTRLKSRQLDGHKFRRQLPIGPYYADFACFEQRLIIELDGGQHAERQIEDGRRTEFFESNGWRVVRFWNNEFSANLDGVLERIHTELAAPHGPGRTR